MSRLKILVVDDNALMADAIKTKLEANGYEVILANEDVVTAEKIDSIKPDMLILDRYIQGVDGIEFCRRLRERPGTGKLPIIMLSTRGKIQEKLTGLRAGVDDFLVKEYDMLDLPYRVMLVFRLYGLE